MYTPGQKPTNDQEMQHFLEDPQFKGVNNWKSKQRHSNFVRQSQLARDANPPGATGNMGAGYPQVIGEDAMETPLVTPSMLKEAKDLREYDQQQTVPHDDVEVYAPGGNQSANLLFGKRSQITPRQPLMTKLFSQQMPLNLGLISRSMTPIEEKELRSVLQRHKEARSHFEQTTILEIYENRVGASPNLWIGYLLVGLVIASGSAFVPLGVALDVANPMLKVSWRVTGLLPFLSVIGFIQAYNNRYQFDALKALKDRKNLANLIIAAMAISLQQYCAIFAGKYTLMSHSVIFVNLSGPVIVGWRLLKKQSVHKLEILGCLIALGGSTISIMDHTSEKTNPAEQNILLGDGVALIGSFLCAVWMLKNEEIVHSMPPLYAMTFIMFFSTIIITVLGLVIYGKSGGFTLSFDPHTGVFGFLGGGLKLASYVLLVYGFFTGACNMGAYSMSCKYFSPLVIGTAVLFEPIGSQIIGCLLGLDKIPGPLTFIGTAVTLAGLFFVSKGGSLNARLTHHL